MDAPRIKVCGITSRDDALLAVEAGAWAVGCILWPESPRACDPAEAARIAATVRRRAHVCGVFVNAPLDHVAGLVDAIGLTMVQLHGDEGPAFCSEVARRTGAKVIKAGPVRGLADIRGLEPFHTDYHLLDAHRSGMRGGTGETFDWELVRSRRSKVPLVLSGGLRPENVADAIAAVRPFAVDTASGTEAAPGVKDPGKVAAFVEAVNATRVEINQA
jgi:phosphoribosylanthranilate isomerase